MNRKLILHLLTILLTCACLLLYIPGPSPALAEDPRLVLAFYYAWYDQNTWSSGLPADQPSQAYTSSDPATIERHVSQAQATGIDAFVQSWYGPQEANNQTETNFRTLLDIAAAKGFQAAVDFETTGPFFADQGSIVDALRHLLAVHAQHPAYLRYQGKPVVFFWRQQRFSVDEWAKIRAQVDPDHDSFWIAEGVDIAYQAVFDGHHLYSIAWSPDSARTLDDWGFRVRRYESQNGVNRLWVATVMPGYDDTRTDRSDAFAVARQDGDYYRATWSAAMASQPDWIMITSFNEWIEGTMIEPSLSYGNLYLDLTRELVRGFKADNPALAGGDQEKVKPSQQTGNKNQEVERSVQVEPYVRAEEAVRVRSGPGTDYSSIGRLWPGDTARVVGQNADGSWWQIEFAESADGIGWVIAEFVTFVGDPDSVPVLGDVTSTPVRRLSPTPSPTPTPSASSIPSASPSPSPTGTSAPTQTAQPTETKPAPTPPSSPTPTATVTPTFTPSPVVSPTASPTTTCTPTLRVAPVAQRRPVGLLWLGGSALVIAVGTGLLLFWTIGKKRRH